MAINLDSRLGFVTLGNSVLGQADTPVIINLNNSSTDSLSLSDEIIVFRYPPEYQFIETLTFTDSAFVFLSFAEESRLGFITLGNFVLGQSAIQINSNFIEFVSDILSLNDAIQFIKTPYEYFFFDNLSLTDKLDSIGIGQTYNELFSFSDAISIDSDEGVIVYPLEYFELSDSIDLYFLFPYTVEIGDNIDLNLDSVGTVVAFPVYQYISVSDRIELGEFELTIPLDFKFQQMESLFFRDDIEIKSVTNKTPHDTLLLIDLLQLLGADLMNQVEVLNLGDSINSVLSNLSSTDDLMSLSDGISLNLSDTLSISVDDSFTFGDSFTKNPKSNVTYIRRYLNDVRS